MSAGVLDGSNSLVSTSDSWDVGSYFSDISTGLSWSDPSTLIALAGIVVVGLVIADA